MKKNIIIILTAAVLLGAAYYYFFWRNQPIAPSITITDPTNAFPGGTTKTTGFNSSSTTADQLNNSIEASQPGAGASFSTSGGQLRQISNQPTSGKTLIKQGVDNYLLFTDKSTGQIHLTNLTKKTPSERLTNTTILRTIKSVWANLNNPTKINGRIVLQYQNKDGQLTFFTANIPLLNIATSTTPTTSTELLGSTLIENEPIIEITTLEDRDQLFYLTRTNPGNSLGYLYNLKTQGKTLVWQSPLNEWVPRWLSGPLVSMQTKASGEVAGSVYLLNTVTRGVTKLVGNKLGLVATVSPSGNKVIYSETASFGGSQLKLLTRATNQEAIIPLKTIADKCTWNKQETFVYCGVPNSMAAGKYPDDWYSGTVNFNDFIWQIEIKTNKVSLIFDPTKTSSTPILDVYQPLLSADGSTLIFTNKNDLTLWALELSKPI